MINQFFFNLVITQFGYNHPIPFESLKDRYKRIQLCIRVRIIRLIPRLKHYRYPRRINIINNGVSIGIYDYYRTTMSADNGKERYVLENTSENSYNNNNNIDDKK